MINLDIPLNDNTIRQIIENNYIDRNKYLNGLLNILNTINESKIIALDGEWGSGKTWFVKSLEYLLNNDMNMKINEINIDTLKNVKNEYMTFYYNAWENDDASSAMLSLIYKLVNDSCLQKENDKTGMFPKILNTLIKYATNGAVDVKNDLFGEQWTNKQITDEIKTSEEIKDTFRELINNLLIENKNKILIIIDEIDRCKPTFAIDLLENIKHFYDDKRIVFLVSTNNKQLSASVCKVYGEKYDGDTYLDKFFDLNLELPNNYIEKYIMAIDENKSSSQYSAKSCREIAKYYNFTMREYNRYLKSIEMIKEYIGTAGLIYYISVPINHIFIPLAMALKIKKKSEYYTFINGNLFSVVEDLIDNNEYFYRIGRNTLKNKNISIIDEIYGMKISEDEKKERERKEIINTLKEIYYNVFNGCNDEEHKWEYKENLENLLDIISMMK